ncbi:MAG: hypothetical protein RR914_00895 [Oscillospiraceae bacterium]
MGYSNGYENNIYEKMNINEYFATQKKYENDLFESFKRAKSEFIISSIISAFILLATWFFIVSHTTPVLIFISIMVLVASLLFPVNAFKRFKKESERYDYRMRALIDKASKRDLHINVPKDDIDEVIKKAYSQYGVKIKWLIAVAVTIILIISVIIGSIIWSETFTFNKWHNIDKRAKIYYELYDINGYQRGENKANLNKDLNIANKSINEIRSLLGKPEVTVTINKSGAEVKPFETYRAEMGNPTTYNWDLKQIPEMSYDCYYIGSQEGSGRKKWVLMFFREGKLKYVRENSGDSVATFSKEDIEMLTKD